MKNPLKYPDLILKYLNYKKLNQGMQEPQEPKSKNRKFVRTKHQHPWKVW